jgi:glycosyltransferase involved in cell wall biosynthesis
MNILQINKYITINGGSEVVMKNLYEIFSSNQHNIRNIGFHKKNQPYIENSTDLGEENLKVKGFFKNTTLINTIVNYILNNKIDMVICHNVYHHFPIYELFKSIKHKTNVKLILYLHDYKVVCPVYNLLRKNKICEECVNKNFYSCALNKCKDNSLIKSTILSLESYYNNKVNNAYQYVDKIISPSFFLRDKVKELGFKHKIDVIHNPLNNFSSFDVINEKENNLLFIGRLSEEKGIHILLNLADRLKNIEINIIGDGPLRNLVEEKAEDLENIIYHGYQQKEMIQKIMKKSKYLLIPSIWYENNPMVVLESMSMGLPIIGANRGGIPELIGNTRGICFEPNNIEESITIIKDMLSKTEDEYYKMSKNAINFAKEKNYTNYYSVLINILGNKK